MMPRIQSFWYGTELPRHVFLCIKSFIDHGHDYRLYSYRPLDLPPGAVACDAADIIAEDRVFFYKEPDGSRGSVSGFSNLFRYKLLRSHGNWWVDTDVLCLSPTLPETECYFGWESDDLIGTAILQVPQNHRLLERAIEDSVAAGTDFGWGQIGPLLVTRLVRELGLEALARPREVAYPTNWREHRLPVTEDGFAKMASLTRGLPFLHLWHEMFRKARDTSIDSPEPGSYLAAAYDQHHVRHHQG